MAESESGRKRGAKPPAGARVAKPAGKPKTQAGGGSSARKAVPRKMAPKKMAVKAARATPTAKPTPARKAAPATKEATSRRTPTTGAKAPRAAGRKAVSSKAAAPGAIASVLSEEDQIRSAKYLPRDLPPRLFEEERFFFPETYGVNRVRLLVKDPDWLFAHWDVDPKVLDSMKKAMGERAMALSRLTLRVVDPANGGSSDILLPAGARGWYIRADQARRAYKAELGVTLPSGEFRRLAESNVVVTPRVGPSRERAQRRITFGQAGRLPKEAALSQREHELESAGSGAGPWKAVSIDGGAPAGVAAGTDPARPSAAPGPATRGGASDTFRPGGASDVHRR